MGTTIVAPPERTGVLDCILNPTAPRPYREPTRAERIEQARRLLEDCLRPGPAGPMAEPLLVPTSPRRRCPRRRWRWADVYVSAVSGLGAPRRNTMRRRHPNDVILAALIALAAVAVMLAVFGLLRR